jgi:predicted Zn-dependent protease
MRWAARIAWAASALAAAACASTRLEPRTSARVAAEWDERSLWRLAAEQEEALDHGGLRLADPDLERYLLEMAHRLQPPAVFEALPFRFRVLRDSVPNAFCFPSGAVYVNTGLLAQIETEGELAFLLAHEMTHATHRHLLREARAQENSSTLLGALGGLGGLIQRASTAGYSRDLEREADQIGLGLMSAAGFDASLATVFFERLERWAAAHPKESRAGAYASHPRLQERIASAREAAGRLPAGGQRGAEPYARAAARAVIEEASMAMSAGRLEEAKATAERAAAALPEDARPHLLLGELARRGNAPEAAASALASYRRAIALDPRLAEAWRGLGLQLQRSGDHAEARRALARYLELAPDAPDRAHVRAYLQTTPGDHP